MNDAGQVPDQLTSSLFLEKFSLLIGLENCAKSLYCVRPDWHDVTKFSGVLVRKERIGERGDDNN